jgi:hypothetical protein
MPSIADLYSSIDSLKRRASDVLSDPQNSLLQMLGYANDRARAYNEQLAEAAQEPGLTGPKTQALAQKIAEAYNPVGMTVWHGSPYKFNAFDASKIGSGEGAQAYGHGLYVAENKNVAKGYQNDVSKASGAEASINGVPLSKLHEQITKKADKLPIEKAQLEYEKAAFLEDLDQQSTFHEALKRIDNEDVEKWAKTLEKDFQPVGNLYKIDLPDEHINKMLDWDKPLNEQPDVIKQAVKNHATLNGMEYYTPKGESSPVVLKQGISGDTSGRDLYKWFGQGNNVASSDLLKFYGIPGIKYLDQGSRGINEGTRNFVIFPGNEHLLNIESINDNPIKSLDIHSPNYINDVHDLLSKTKEPEDIYSPNYLENLHTQLANQQ